LQHAPGDVLIGSAKVAGSAQRRHRGALLQHGAVLLAASPHTLSLPGIKEQTGTSLSVTDTCAAVRDAFVQATGWQLVEGEMPAGEKEAVAELVARKYTSEGWNCKR